MSVSTLPTATQAVRRRPARSLLAVALGWIAAHPYVVAGVASFLLFFAYSGRRSLWGDEAFTVNLAYLPWDAWLQAIWGSQANMALYFAVLRAWIWLSNAAGLHSTEMIVRLPSVVFAACSVVGVLAIGRRILGDLAGWASAALYAISTNTLYFSGETRSYSLYVAATVWGYWCLLAAVSDASRASEGGAGGAGRMQGRALWVGYVLAMTITVYAQFIAVTFIAAQVATYALLLLLPSEWRDAARRRVRWMAGSTAAIAVLSAPILLDGLLHGAMNQWVPIPTWTTAQQLYTQLATGYNPTSTVVIATFAILGAIATLAVEVGRPWRKAHPSGTAHDLAPDALPDTSGSLASETATRVPSNSRLDAAHHAPRQTGLLICLVGWLFLPAAVAYALSQQPLDQHLFLFRYQLGIFPPLFLLVGLFLAYAAPHAIRVALAVLLAWLVVVNWYAYHTLDVIGTTSPNFAYLGYKQALDWAEDHAQPGDGVMCVGDYSCILLTQYYLTDAWPDRPLQISQDSPGTGDGFGLVRSLSPQLTAHFATEHRRIFVVVTNGAVHVGNGQSARWLRTNLTFIQQHYKLLGTYHTPTVDALLYQT